MIHLDTSVALAALFAEARQLPDRLWRQTSIASRLLEYELMVRIHHRGLGAAAVATAQKLLEAIALVELDRRVLTRALLPFVPPVRTLDALHLATMDYLRQQGQSLTLATYDQRLAAGAAALGFALADCWLGRRAASVPAPPHGPGPTGSLDDLGRLRQHRLRHGDPQGPGRPLVDQQFELKDALDRNVGRLRAVAPWPRSRRCAALPPASRCRRTAARLPLRSSGSRTPRARGSARPSERCRPCARR
ncbi:MAG: PIN domain-containing protein [Burkholderiales bacterium]|nr:PIN domain-containing protein [Burkholderiales bacterium]